MCQLALYVSCEGFNSSNNRTGGAEILKTKHKIGDPFYVPVILFDYIV